MALYDAAADLGTARFSQEVGAITNRDTALLRGQPVNVIKKRAPKGLEAKVFAWSNLQHVTDDKDEKEEAKGDLHGGQLYRQNRIAQQQDQVCTYGGYAAPGGFGGLGHGGFNVAPDPGYGGGGKKKKGKGKGRAGADFVDGPEGVRAAIHPGEPCAPQAKGIPEELSASLFWSGPIVGPLA